MKVTGVSAGAATTMSVNANGTYTAIPVEPITATDGTCTVTLVDTLWVPKTLAVTLQGAGYTASPAVTFPAGRTGYTQPVVTVTLGGASLNIAAGGAAVNLSSAGVGLVGPVALTPSSPLDNTSCTAGQIAVDANYVYVCTATNTWKRAALSGF